MAQLYSEPWPATSSFSMRTTWNNKPACATRGIFALPRRPRPQAALASERSISTQLEQDLSTAVTEGINYRDNLRKLIEIREQAARPAPSGIADVDRLSGVTPLILRQRLGGLTRASKSASNSAPVTPLLVNSASDLAEYAAPIHTASAAALREPFRTRIRPAPRTSRPSLSLPPSLPPPHPPHSICLSIYLSISPLGSLARSPPQYLPVSESFCL